MTASVLPKGPTELGIPGSKRMPQNQQSKLQGVSFTHPIALPTHAWLHRLGSCTHTLPLSQHMPGYTNKEALYTPYHSPNTCMVTQPWKLYTPTAHAWSSKYTRPTTHRKLYKSPTTHNRYLVTQTASGADICWRMCTSTSRLLLTAAVAPVGDLDGGYHGDAVELHGPPGVVDQVGVRTASAQI